MGRDYKFRNDKTGKEVFSFSKLSTFCTCNYSYYLSYIKHVKSKDSIYGKMGTIAHECSQDLVEGKIDNDEAIDKFETNLDDAINVLDLRFPTEKSGENFQECIVHFLENYKPDIKKYDIEKGFDVLIGNTKTLVMGFIDLIIYNDDGTVDVVDYKTSSKFNKHDFEKKKMQLIIYAKSLMEEGYKINRLYFNMLKYCTIKWDEINSKKQLVHKSTMCERNKIGDKLKAVSKRLLKKKSKVNKMIQTNEIDEELKDVFEIVDYEVDVDFSEQSIKEMENWIDDIINTINSFGKEEENYKHTDIKKSSMFCKSLCGKDCKYYKEYESNDKTSYRNKKKIEIEKEDEEFDDLL